MQLCIGNAEQVHK